MKEFLCWEWFTQEENLNPIEGDESMCTAHAARLAFEIGCDVAKVSWKGDENSLIAVRKAVPIPILITPGTGITSDLELLKLVQKGMELGANGVCMGRSVFGHKSPKSIATALRLIVHEGKSAEEAILETGFDMEIWLYPSGDDSDVIDGIDRVIGKDVRIVDDKLYQNETLIGARIVISNDEDQNNAISLAGSALGFFSNSKIGQ